MQLLLIRHAIAEDRDEFAATGEADANRPLTDRGAKRMRRAARGLRRLQQRIDWVAASPYTRALQTAEILVRAFDKKSRPRLETTPVLEPGCSPQRVGAWLAEKRAQDGQTVVALVGHEPDLSLLTAYLTAGVAGEFVRFKKGGACLIDCASGVEAGEGELVWMVTPAILRRIGM